MSPDEFAPSYTESYEVIIVANNSPLAMTTEAYVAYQDRSLFSTEVELSADGSHIVNTGDAYIFRLQNITTDTSAFLIYSSEDDDKKLYADTDEFLCFGNIFRGITWDIYGSDGIFTIKNIDAKKYRTLFCSKTSGRFNLTDKSDETTEMRIYMHHNDDQEINPPVKPDKPMAPSVSYDRDVTICGDGAVSLYGLTDLHATLTTDNDYTISYRNGDTTEFTRYRNPIAVSGAGEISFFAGNSAGVNSDTITVTFAGGFASVESEWLRASTLSDIPTADGESADVIIVSDNTSKALTSTVHKSGSYDMLKGAEVILSDDGDMISDIGEAYIFKLEQFASLYTLNGTEGESASRIAITKSESLVFTSDASVHYQWRINQYDEGIFVIKNATSNTKYPAIAYYDDETKDYFDLSSDPNQLNHLRIYVGHQNVIDTVRPALPAITYSREVKTSENGEIKLDKQEELSAMFHLPGHDIFYNFNVETDGRRRANDLVEYSRYQTPIQIESPGTLSYYAVSADGRHGDTGSITFVRDNTTNSSTSIIADSQEDVIYDLQGRRIHTPARHGLYIINGQKTFIH
ncbi:MAG: hypothetical protein K2M97_02580 [Muribaculaceae bacterium]|nr:hypothetical protein [Muribaculaceae bacterium]